MESNLLTRILAAIVTVIALAVSFVVGLVAALVTLGLVIIGWMAFAFRFWRLKRAARRQPEAGHTTVEGEYRVVHRQEGRADD